MENTPFAYYSQIAKRNRVEEAKTSDYTILETEVGKSFSNDGAKVAIVLTLPDAKRGMVFTFHRKASPTLSINTSSGDTDYIRDPINAIAGTKKITLTGRNTYPSVRFVCLEDGLWSCQVLTGAVSDVIAYSGSRTATKEDRKQVDDVTLTDIDSGDLFSNEGTAKDIEVTLPPATVGLNYGFLVYQGGNAITLTPDGTEQFIEPVTGVVTTGGASISSGQKHAYIWIECQVGGIWTATEISGKWFNLNISKTVDYNVLATYNGASFNNSGDADAIVFTLPAAVVGLKYTFDVLAAYQMTLTPASGEQICNPLNGRVLAADESLVNSGVIGSNIEIECVEAGIWTVRKAVGDWLNGIIAKTANFDIEAADSGKKYSNAGASGAITAALPAAIVGLKYTMYVQAAQELQIAPDGAETIALPSTGAQSAAGKYIVADAIGENVEIECVVAGTWNVNRYIGTWTAQA